MINVKYSAVPGTSRIRLTSECGKVLDRQIIYLPPDVWDTLQGLSRELHKSGSEVIEMLLKIADEARRNTGKPLVKLSGNPTPRKAALLIGK